MLQARTALPLEAVEGALRRAAQKHQAHLIASTHVGRHLTPGAAPCDASVFSICQADLYAGLLDGDIRMSVFLPCRVAAYTDAGQVVLATVSPLEFCRILNRPDLSPFAAPLESLLTAILEEAAASPSGPAHHAPGLRGALGATEDQVNQRGMVPQRIDRHGTKVEDMAGTGEHDTQGG